MTSNATKQGYEDKHTCLLCVHILGRSAFLGYTYLCELLVRPVLGR